MNRATPSVIRTIAAAFLIGCVALSAPLAQAPAADNVSLSGRIFQADGSTPYANVTVRVLDQATGQEVASVATANDGSYSFDGLAPGTYTFEVEVPEGVYQLDRAIALGSSESATISFTVKPEAGAAGTPGAAQGSQQGMSKKKKGALIAIIAGGAVLAAVLLRDSNDDKNDGASPFTP